MAVSGRNREAARLLTGQGADVTVARHDRWTPLHQAAGDGEVELVELLLDHGAKVNVCYGSDLNCLIASGTPLHVAIVRDASDRSALRVARLLLAHGAEVSFRTPRGWAPLHYAALARRTKIAELLLQHAADIEAKSRHGRTPLHLAVNFSYDSTEVVGFLLEHGAHVNARDRDGRTALHLAAGSRRDKTQVADFLLKHGADVNARDTEGRTPLDLARSAKTAELLRRCGGTR